MRHAVLVGMAWLTGCVTEKEQARLQDRDSDGYRAVEVGGLDCDDSDSGVSPGAEEVCGDGIDNDCNSTVDDFGLGDVPWFRDADGDGYGIFGVVRRACEQADLEGWVLESGDCDDNDKALFPDAVELCDGVDNNCDSITDEGC